LQELHEPSIAKALTKASNASESSKEAPPPTDSITESHKIIEIHSDWRTPLMIYLRTRGLPEHKAD
jgi:hypothetical protein